MTEDLVLSVPDRLPSMYLVPVSMPEVEAVRIASQAVARRVPEPLRGLTARLIGTPALTVSLRPLSAVTPLPVGGLSVEGLPAGGPDLPADSETADFVAFATMAPPHPGPAHEWITRAAAAAFAADLDLPIVDTFAGRALTADDALATLPGAPRLTGVPGGFRLADWLAVWQSGRCLTTSGLGRFGLPELRLDDVPPELRRSWTIALTGLSHRLLETLRRELRRAKEVPFVRVPARVEISRTDVGAAYGLDLTEDARTLPVRLSLDPAIADELECYLSVDGPNGQPAAEHRRMVQAALFRQSATSGIVGRRARWSPRMATARARRP